MIKTLRITTIIAAILAVGFFVFPAVYGVRSDEQTERFLDLPGVIERFNKAKGDKRRGSESQISPLVKEAEAFALYLNPPKPVKRVKVPPKRSVGPIPPSFSTKFKLIGTSYYASHPELSLALIDEPGKGLRWVRQGSEVSRLIIEEIKAGLVVIRDGQETRELVPVRLPKMSYLKGASSVPARVKAATGPVRGKRPGPTAVPSVGASKGAGRGPTQMSPEEENALARILEGMQADIESGKIDSGRRAKESEEMVDEIISELASMRISREEAKKLGRLGKELKDAPKREERRSEPSKDVRRDPNRAGKP